MDQKKSNIKTKGTKGIKKESRKRKTKEEI